MLKLIISDPACPLPDSYRDEDGFFSVAIPPSVAASLNYDSASLSELGTIISSFSNQFELVADQRTQNLLSRLHFRKNRQGLSAKVKGALLISGHYFPGLIVVQRTRQNLHTGNISYSITFIGTHQTWKEAARKMSICQIDCGTFFNSPANIEASWANSAYTPGGQPFYLPLVSKGAWLNPAYRMAEDFDFIVVYLAHLLLQGFCSLGYTVESEFIHTTEFRKKAAYLLSDEYFNRENILKFGAFRATWTQHILPVLFPIVYPVSSGNINFGQLVICDDDNSLPNFDYNNLYYPNNPPMGIGQFSGYSGSCAFSGTINFTFVAGAPNPVFQIPESAPTVAYAQILISTSSGTTITAATGAVVNVVPGSVNTVSVISADLFLVPTDKVSLHLIINNIYTTQTSWTIDLSPGTAFSNNPRNNILQRNQTLIINQLLNCEINFYQILEDLTRLYNLQYYTNAIERKVYIEPEYRWQDWQGLPHRGSLRDISQAYDVTQLVNTQEDIEKDLSAPENKRYMQFLFAEGSDWHNTRYKEQNNRELHSSEKIEVGDSGNEVEEVRLNLFAPTQTIYDEPQGFSDPTAIQVPAIWSAAPETGSPYPKERAYSIGGRILHIHGLGVQPNKYGNLPVWYFEDTTPRNAYPKAWQVNKDNPSNSSLVFASPLTGKNQLNTFFRNLKAIRQQLLMSVVLSLTPNNIACLDTRYPLLISSQTFPPEVAGYYYIKKLQILGITQNVQRAEADLVPLSFVQECEALCNLTIAYNYINPTETGAEDGVINITAIGGYTGVVTVTLTNTENEVVFVQSGIDPGTDLPLSITDLPAGVYLLSAMDEAGCTVQQQVILSNPCVVVIDATGANPTEEGASDGSITINSLTGVLYPVAVIVKQGAANVFSQSGVTEPDLPLTATNLPAGTYTVIVIDSAGCSTSLSIALTDVGDCIHPPDFAVSALSDTSVTLNWTVTVGNTYNVRYKLTTDALWTTLTGVTPALLIPGLDPCLDYEFQIETLCDGESIGFTPDSIYATTECPCNITFTVTPIEGAGIAVTDIEGLTEGASPIIVVTDCDNNPVPNYWEAVPECYKVCVIDSCTCCRGCQTSCFITLDEPVVSECNEDGTVNVLIDVADTNLVGNLQLYYSLDGLTWYNGGLSTPGVGWLLNGIPSAGGQMWIRVENPDDDFCNDETVINLPNCCGTPGLDIVTDACDTYQLWITSDSFEIPFSAELTEITIFGTTYTPPAPLSFTDLQAVEDWLNSLGLPYLFIVVLASLETANIYLIGECCQEYEVGNFEYVAIDGETTYNVTLEFLSNLTCDLIQEGTPLFTCCTCIQAEPTGTVYGVDTDVIEYSLDGGLTWQPYTIGQCIDPDDQPLLFKRTVTFTNGCPPAEITETYTPPGCENDLGLSVNCEPMIEVWAIPILETYTLVSITIAGVTYTSPAPIILTDYTALLTFYNSLGTPYYFSFGDGGNLSDSTLITVVGQPCVNYSPGDITLTYNDGASNQNATLALFIEQPCSLFAQYIPGYDCGECCNCATAEATGTASGINNDIIEYSIDGGLTWFEYFPPQCINPNIYDSNEVIFRRTVNFTNGCPPVVLTETVGGVPPCIIIITDVQVSACNEGMVDVEVTFTASGVSGNVVVAVGALGSETVAAGSGSAIVSVPANGETVIVSVANEDNPACANTFELTLPDCPAEFEITDNASSTDCEDPTAFAYINFVNTGYANLPMGTVFNLAWTGLGGSPTFTSLSGGTVAPDGSTFTLDAYDIIPAAGFSFYVEWNNPGCYSYTLELTISSTDIAIAPVTIVLYLS